MYLSVLTCFVCFAGTLSSNLLSPCKVSDVSCIEESVNTALPQIFNGIPELGIESSDPLFIHYIRTDEDDSTFKLSLSNSTVIGFKNCTISNIKFYDEFSKIRSDADCQGFQMWGKYELKGRLITMPVEGLGDFKFSTGKFFLNIDNTVEKVRGNDGKTHLVIKSFKVNPKPVTFIRYNFKNLFNGQKHLSDAVHEYTEKNWLEITELIQLPMWYRALNTVVKNVNTYLEQVDVKDIHL